MSLVYGELARTKADRLGGRSMWLFKIRFHGLWLGKGWIKIRGRLSESIFRVEY